MRLVEAEVRERLHDVAPFAALDCPSSVAVPLFPIFNEGLDENFFSLDAALARPHPRTIHHDRLVDVLSVVKALDDLERLLYHAHVVLPVPFLVHAAGLEPTSGKHTEEAAMQCQYHRTALATPKQPL